MPDIAGLARTYHPLLNKTELERAFSRYAHNTAGSSFSKHELHKRINDLIFKKYSGEGRLKYKLASYFNKIQYEAGFEVKVDKSRADFLAINGFTKCFEIKSELDNLDRLSTQLTDYLRVFEYVYVVADNKHLSELSTFIDPRVGLWTFIGHKKIEIRGAQFNTTLNSEAQIRLLNKSELKKAFKSDDFPGILENHSANQINDAFKRTLKHRYHQRWNFVKSEWNHILPCDLQFFFNTNVCPRLIYNS